MTDIADGTDFTELVDADVPRVDLVGQAANGVSGFLLMKQDEAAGLLDPGFVRELIGKSQPEPRPQETVTMTGSPAAIFKLIHEAAVAKAKYDADDLKRMAANGQAMDDESYPIADKEDLGRAVRAVGRGGTSHDAIRRHIITRAKSLGASSEIPDNWNADGSLKGDVAKEIDMDDDALDPMTALAEPDNDMPGMDTDPGSPAWEAIDAATAFKWTSILARARAAIDLLAEREMLEAASADPDDAENAFDLQDACCAIDYAISVLAPFAVAEQAEADCCDDMQTVGKALASFDSAGLDTIEALSQVAKAGRVLSAANEAAIRTAAEHLQTVLTSLPAAPVEKEGGRTVAKTANEEPDMPTSIPSEDVTAASGQEPAMGSQEPTPKPVEKADDAKNEVVVVYDQKGRLVGIVDPGDITPVANAEAEPDDMSSDADSGEADDSDDSGSDDTQTTDLDPQPADQAGTPADAVPDDDSDGVAKSRNDQTNSTDLSDIKSSLLAAVEDVVTKHSATQENRLVKTGDAVLELAELVKTLSDRIGTLEEQPAEPRVFTQGAGPVPQAQHLRGHTQGANPAAIDVTKAAELKKELYGGHDAAKQQQAFLGLQEMAIAQLAAMRAQQ